MLVYTLFRRSVMAERPTNWIRMLPKYSAVPLIRKRNRSATAKTVQTLWKWCGTNEWRSITRSVYGTLNRISFWLTEAGSKTTSNAGPTTKATRNSARSEEHTSELQ